MSDSREDEEYGLSVITRPEKKTKLEKPRMYQVLLHNDDFTPREFVVLLLRDIFQKAENSAVTIMMKAHQSGLARVAVYSFEIAESKAHRANEAAQSNEFPLKFSVEPVENDEGDQN